jgi:hypothetical protein
MNLVTPKVGAKDELLFNIPASGACLSGEHLNTKVGSGLTPYSQALD